MLKEGADVWNMPSNQASAHGLEIPDACGNGLKWVPLSQGLFCVAEISKQDICVYKCRKPGVRLIRTPRLSCFKGHIPLTPGVALRARNTVFKQRRRLSPPTKTTMRGSRSA